MEHHCQPPQNRETYRSSGGDGRATNEKRVPRHPASDADKVVDTTAVPEVTAISPPRNDIDSDAALRPRPTDSEILPKGPPDTD